MRINEISTSTSLQPTKGRDGRIALREGKGHDVPHRPGPIRWRRDVTVGPGSAHRGPVRGGQGLVLLRETVVSTRLDLVDLGVRGRWGGGRALGNVRLLYAGDGGCATR